MARSYKQPSIVSGLSIDEILNIDNAAFNNLNLSDMRKMVGRLVSAGNKRLRRLESSGISTPASRAAKKSGGEFSTKGKNLNQLRAEYIRAKQFMESKTSTKTGHITARNEFVESIKNRGIDLKAAAVEDVKRKLKKQEKTVEDIGKREYNKMLEEALQRRTSKLFRSYEKVKDLSPEVAEKWMKYRVFQQITEITKEDPNISPDKIANKIQKRLTAIYEEQKENENDFDISQLFEM